MKYLTRHWSPCAHCTRSSSSLPHIPDPEPVEKLGTEILSGLNRTWISLEYVLGCLYNNNFVAYIDTLLFKSLHIRKEPFKRKLGKSFHVKKLIPIPFLTEMSLQM